jgi:Domain of unknown function (DUF4331)
MRIKQTIARVGAAAALIGTLAFTYGAQPTGASSHREAPLISQDPLADNTDLYAFRSPDKPDTVTIVANYIPLEEPNGGPNFATFGDDVRYEVNIDNTGDAKPDITYRWTFYSELINPNTFLYITFPVNFDAMKQRYQNLNVQQFYKLERIVNGKSSVLGINLPVAPNNVGPRSTPDYDTLANAAVLTLGDTMAFAGPRDDPFFVDLGSIFDLGGLRPFNGAHLLPLATEDGIDGVSGYNTHSLIVQVPISKLTKDHKGASETAFSNLGIWATASRQQLRVLRTNGTVQNLGRWIQVSRLGNPLINEVVIPLGDKDYWNSQPPHRDYEFEKYYLKPELAGIVNTVYPVLPDARTEDRTDLTLILLTGIPGVNKTGDVKADMLRLNVAIAPSAPVGQGNPLTVITTDPNAAPDLAGFPNGRRLEDDVTDIEIRAVIDGYGFALNSLFGLPNNSPNNVVGDGVNANDKPFTPTFPYVAAPHSGYDSSLHR